jgi:hypothetical protein
MRPAPASPTPSRRRGPARVAAAAGAILALAGLLPAGPAHAATGGEVDLVHPAEIGTIRGFSVSASGRQVSFVSEEQLLPADTDANNDIYFYDRDDETLELVSKNVAAGTDGFAFSPTISGNGAVVAFSSTSSTHVAGDTNSRWDIFAWHRATGTVELVSVDTGGGLADDDSAYNAIDHSGSSVAFMSGASDLVAGDTNGGADIFVRNLATDTTERVSVRDDESQITLVDNSARPEISADGRVVTFWSQGNVTTPTAPAAAQLYMRDRDAGTTTLITADTGGQPASLATYAEHALSADGTTVVFYSASDDLVAGDAVSGIEEAFVWSPGSSIQRIASLPGGGQPTDQVHALGLSPDGDLMVVQTAAPLLATDADGGSRDFYVIRRSTGSTYLASFKADGSAPTGGASEMPDATVVDDLGTIFFGSNMDLIGDGSSDIRLWQTRPCAWPAASFGDVPATHPFACDIAWSVGRSVASGYPDGTFRPTTVVSRQVMAAFLHGLFDGGTAPDPGFSDVPPGHLFFDEIAWLVDEGIATGFPDGTFRPTAPVSRQAMAAFMYRAAGAPDGDDPSCASAPFPDVPVSHDFCGEIAWLVGTGVTTGFADGTFQPADPVTRQSTVAFLQRLRAYVLIPTGGI